MRFEWDEAKNRQNQAKHGISFDVAAEVFSDPFSLTFVDRTLPTEERLWTIGRIASLVLLVVVHTTTDDEGEEVIRIISARRAGPRERRAYEEG